MNLAKWMRRKPIQALALGLGILGSLASSRAHKKPVQLVASGEAFQNLTAITENLKGCYQPTISRDGSRLIFVSSKDGNNDLYLKDNPTAVALRKLTTHGASDITPAFSPDGNRVVFASNRSGSYDLFIMKLDGGVAKQQLTDTVEDEYWPSWSPDGQKIAYSRYSRIDGQYYIWIKELDTNANIQLGPGRRPRFSPDGTHLLFEKAPKAQRGTSWYSLWTMKLDGSSVTQLTTGSEWGAINGRWSPDGQKIVFTSSKGVSGKAIAKRRRRGKHTFMMRNSDSNLWVMNSNGGELTQMTTHEADDFQAFWSRPNHIYFTSNRDGKDRIWRFEVKLTDGYTPAPMASDTPTPAVPSPAASDTPAQPSISD